MGNVGDGNSFVIEEIKDFVKKRSNAVRFTNFFDNWKGKVSASAETNDFFERKDSTFLRNVILISIAIIVLSIMIIVFTLNFTAIFTILSGMILIVSSLAMKKRTYYGAEQYRMWESFKRFIKDFSRMQDATIPSVAIWEQYLVYSIPFGLAKTVMKQFPKIAEVQDIDQRAYYNNYGLAYAYTSLDSIDRTIRSSVSTAKAGTYSSSTGSGGGVSGGSSGGGGGGGGGGAF